MVTSTGMLICSTIMMAPLAIFSGSLGASVLSMQAIAAVIGIAAISTAMAYLLYFRILASAGATNVLLVTFLIPVSAVLLGIGVLGEVIHVLEYVGMGCIFLGLIFIFIKTYQKNDGAKRLPQIFNFQYSIVNSGLSGLGFKSSL